MRVTEKWGDPSLARPHIVTKYDLVIQVFDLQGVGSY